METIILNILAFRILLYILQVPKDMRTITKFGKHIEYDDYGYINTVRTNMMNDPNYSGYCGNSWDEQKRKNCDMPRTKWDTELKQFRCPKCNWTSQFPDDFIKRYINQHRLYITREYIQQQGRINRGTGKTAFIEIPFGIGKRPIK